jgi:LmbE family N-acetylglucosaminyl deacetylase/ActR/RegA family two-component response regulator
MDNSPTRGRILLIDDDLALGGYMSRVLRTHGPFEVTHELDAGAALRSVQAEQWDLLITDIEMPGITGLELVKQVRRLAPDLPIMIVSGHVTVDNVMTALRRSVAEFLPKPVAAEDLIGRATALVEAGRKARVANREIVLAIGAHPDDIEIGAGGTLLAHRAAGDTIAMLTMSRGAAGGDAERRVRESQQAAEVIGAQLFLKDLEDTKIPEGNPTIALIEEVIAEVEPTVVYTHSGHDVHQDHRNVHRAAMVAAVKVGQVYCYQSPSATIDFHPAHFVAVDQHIGVKLSTVEIFGRQAAIRDYLDPAVIESTARYWSRFGGGSHAEAFEVVRHRASRPAQPLPGAVPDQRSRPASRAGRR